MSKKFGVGDKVYCPRFGTGVYTVYSDAYCNSPLVVRTPTGSFLGIDGDGKHNEHDVLPSVFHVTTANRNLLCQLYNVEFDKPKRKLKGSELCKHLLHTHTHVICKVDDNSDDATYGGSNYRIDCVFAYHYDSCLFVGSGKFSSLWRYAVPINPETLQPLEMEIDDE